MPRKRSWGKLVEVDAGTQYVLRGDMVVVGRTPANDIVLKESYVSGKHFTLSKVGNGEEQVLLTDNSSNGTFSATDAEHMDKGRLKAKTSIKLGHGELIGIGPKPNITPPCFWTFQVTPAPLALSLRDAPITGIFHLFLRQHSVALVGSSVAR